MRAYELKERLEKAEAKVDKCKATIERHKKQAEKKLQFLRDNGWEQERYRYAQAGSQDAYWAVCEYENKLQDIKAAENKLKEAERIAENWREKLRHQVEIDKAIEEEVPDAFRQARQELITKWVKEDIAAREIMRQKRKELEYKEFREIYKYTTEQNLDHTDEEFERIEDREANIWLLDLYNRVKEITGEITDCRYIHWGGKGLDGYIIGKKGIADVETIGAGGYNIQRYHLRVLVHKKVERKSS